MNIEKCIHKKNEDKAEEKFLCDTVGRCRNTVGGR